MNKKIWFKAKNFGWGWYPITWQGWVITLLYVLAIVPIGVIVGRTAHSGSDSLIAFSIPFIFLTSLLIAICWMKGERPQWRWEWPPKK
jgi:hypothetical protein